MVRVKIFWIFIIFCFYFILNLQAQTNNNRIPLSFALSNNSTQLPGSGYLGFINMPVHPGITLGTFKCYNEKNTMFQTLKFSYYYHQYSHNAFQIYTDFRYDYKLGSKYSISTNIGIGYMYSFVNVQAFTLNKNGTYQSESNYGRSQFTAGLELDINYDIIRNEKNPIRIFLGYKFMIQTPFVNEYVPILPYTSINIGTIFYLNKSKNNSNE